MATETHSVRVVTVEPTKGWLRLNLKELWAYRELLYFLVWRSVKVRYKQTVIGIGWAIIQPLFAALMFAFVFGVLAGVSSGGIPLILFTYSGLLLWNLFSKGLTDGSQSLVANEALVTKVYFPRLILPIAAVSAGIVDFLFAFVVYFGLAAYYGTWPSIAILAVPIFIVIALMAASGIAFWFSAIDAKYRDVRQTLPFLSQLWFFATPVVYPLSKIPISWRWLYSLNPMVGVVEGFRWAIFGEAWDVDLVSFALSISAVLLIFFGGLTYFRRAERIFADTV